MVVIPQRPPSLYFADCRQRSSTQKKKKKKGKADGLSTPPVIFHINSCPSCRPNIVTSTERRRWEGTFFFQIFYRDCFHRRSRDSGKWRGIASDVFYNDPRSASGSGRAGFLFAREDFWNLFWRIPFFLDSRGNVFKECLIFRIFVFYNRVWVQW